MMIIIFFTTSTVRKLAVLTTFRGNTTLLSPVPMREGKWLAYVTCPVHLHPYDEGSMFLQKVGNTAHFYTGANTKQDRQQRTAVTTSNG